MVRLAELSKEELFAPGHRMCAGCGAGIAVRMALKAVRGPTVVVNATGCVEVASTIYPYTAWRLPWLHITFENAGAAAGGVEAAFKALERKGLAKKPDIIAFGGDGGTFDIGLQSLSGALERGHDFVYICYDNEAYMNTGIQRSGGTPHGASTTTSPAGTVIPGKPEWKKDLAAIAAAHRIPFAATASIAYWNDYITKVQRAIAVDGPAVVHVIAPCPRGWRYDPSQTVRIARLAVQTRIFPVYEVDNGRYKLNVRVREALPVTEYLKPQGRFRHLFKAEFRGELERIQKNVDENWERLARLCEQ
ncbi:MAG: pyruvate synthase subunit PorB [Candidatus Bathyarchaeia archaeon]